MVTMTRQSFGGESLLQQIDQKGSNLALDEVRAGEARRMVQDGCEPVLKKSRWCLLKRPENLTDTQRVTLSDVLRYNLASVRRRRACSCRAP